MPGWNLLSLSLLLTLIVGQTGAETWPVYRRGLTDSSKAAPHPLKHRIKYTDDNLLQIKKNEGEGKSDNVTITQLSTTTKMLPVTAMVTLAVVSVPIPTSDSNLQIRQETNEEEGKQDEDENDLDEEEDADGGGDIGRGGIGIILLPSPSPPTSLQELASLQQSASSAAEAARSSASAAISSAKASASSLIASISSSADMAVSSLIPNTNMTVSSNAPSATYLMADASTENDEHTISASQAALGIIGAIIGSSALTILILFGVLRWRKAKKQQIMTMTLVRKPSDAGYREPSPIDSIRSAYAFSPTLGPPPTPLKTPLSAHTLSRSLPPQPHLSSVTGAINTNHSGYEYASPESMPLHQGFPSPGTRVAGYASSDYGYGSWSAARPESVSSRTPLVRVTSTSSTVHNFSRRHTRTESAPVSTERNSQVLFRPSFESAYIPGHSRSPSTNTLGGIGVGGDMRSPLRRNIVSVYPRSREGGGVMLVRSENRVSSHGGAKDAPLPPPPLEEQLDRLSRVSEETGYTKRSSAGPAKPLELEKLNVSPLSWPYGPDGSQDHEK